MADKNVLTVHEQKTGDKGVTGETGIGVDDIDGTLLANPTALYLAPNNQNCNVTRAGDALILDRYNNYTWVNGDDISNFCEYSSDDTQWMDTFNRWSVDSTGNPDPFGGNTAAYFKLDTTTSQGDVVVEVPVDTVTPNKFNTISFWFKKVSGTINAVNITIGSTTYKVEDDVSNDWVRLRTSIASGSGSFVFGIDPVGDSGAIFGLIGVQFEEGSVLNDYLENNTGSVLTIPNPNSAARQNGLGYLIENSKENLIEYAEDLTKGDWDVQFADLLEYEPPDLFNDRFKNINIRFTNSATANAITTAALVEGESYTFSVFVNLLSGIVDAISGYVGGTKGVMTDIVEGEYTRIFGEFIAGSTNEVRLEIISSGQDADLLVEGFQLETGSISTYTRTAATAQTRPEDDFTDDFPPININTGFTLAFSQNAIISSASNRYIVSNGVTGSNELSVRYNNDILTLNINGTESQFSDLLDAKNIAFTRDDNGNVNLYKDSLLFDTAVNNGLVTGNESTIYLGSDISSANNINAYLGNIYMHDEELTALEVRSLLRVD